MKPSNIVTGFVDYLISGGSREMLPQVSRELSAIAKETDENYNVIIISAVPLNEKEKKHIHTLLTSVFNRTSLEFENTVDPSIIGGVRIQIGDTLIDASVRGQLEGIKRQLLS